MSDQRMTAREILATVLSEATGKPPGEVAEILSWFPLKGLDREHSPEEARRWLAAMRRDMPGIEAWLQAGAARFEARLAMGISPDIHH